ncbi:CDP-alcohol phosphatidyltransferase family protein [Halomonas sp. HL-93]|uniref:CDP-alcohol phosphatidyltransferase family protein n=1 Tax=Halomonas sp. HL-93 TaxID=1666906 RepID=UPI0006DB3667|nr:CDP-alcohol phosphatidyltransferase family protein [Halomonas sp. HL-93]KPQ21419.1 MAG: CDP-alcohol phosphatidyltransferase [Halomonas sp. HL-93]SBR47261.1 Phosphatidylglycerophosphate synthase [Halomonas sp. HL-93]
MHSFTNTPPISAAKRCQTAMEVVLGGIALGLSGWLLPSLISGPYNWVIAVLCYGLISGLVITYWPYGSLGWANRITLARAVLVALVAGALASQAFATSIWSWLAIAVLALLLDGIDGWVARRTHSYSLFGARFDMELDALLIMLLCVGLWLDSLGEWVLLIGGMRYLFVAAGWQFTWLSQPLFVSIRRKAVCVWQVAALLLALTPLTSPFVAGLLALSALLSLIYSFGVDVWWLYRQSHAK